MENKYGPVTERVKTVLDAVHKASRYNRKFRVKIGEIESIIGAVAALEAKVSGETKDTTPPLEKATLPDAPVKAAPKPKKTV